MNLTLKLTERDKKLLVFLAVLLLFFGYYYLLLQPTLDAVDSLSVQEDNLTLRRQQMEMNIVQISAFEKALEEAEVNYEKQLEPFWAGMSTAEVDAYLTSIFVDEGFYISEFSIEPAQKQPIAPYALSEKAKWGKQGVDSEGKKYTLVTETDTIYTCQANYVAVGTKEMIENVLDLFAQTDGILVVGFECEDVTQQIAAGNLASYVGQKYLDIDLVLYMVRK